jgi:hypothetical protein
MNCAVNTSQYIAANCDCQRVLYLKACRRKRSDFNTRYQLISCLVGMGKTTITPHNNRCPDRDMTHATIEINMRREYGLSQFCVESVVVSSSLAGNEGCMGE